MRFFIFGWMRRGLDLYQFDAHNTSNSDSKYESRYKTYMSK